MCRHFFQKLASTWQDFNLEVDDMVASGDRVCVIGRAGGELAGVQASYGFVHAWTVRDGVCVRFDEYVDPSPELIGRSSFVVAGQASSSCRRSPCALALRAE